MSNAEIAAWTMVMPPFCVELIGHQGYDVVFLDMQHGSFGLDDVVAGMIALEGSGARPIVRVPGNDPAMINRVLDAGARGVLCPMVDTPAETAAFVRACRYPPHGHRSFGPFRASMRTGPLPYLAQADDDIWTIVNVESVQAVEQIDEIVATPGLDMVFVGSADLSLSGGGDPVIDYEDPVAVERHQRIFDACRGAGVKIGCIAVKDEQVPVLKRWGVDLIAVAPDFWLFANASQLALENARRAA